MLFDNIPNAKSITPHTTIKGKSKPILKAIISVIESWIYAKQSRKITIRFNHYTFDKDVIEYCRIAITSNLIDKEYTVKRACNTIVIFY